MKLLSCHVEHFGKLSEYERSFSSGMNVVLEENGWGKSTLAAFLRVMFFGFDNEGKRDAVLNERQRLKPWSGGAYGGSVCFEVHGRQYRMERFFGEKRSADTFRLFSLPDGLPSSDYAENAGEELFGLDADSFERTVFIAQEDCEISITPGISARIGNLSGETADMGNYEEAQTRLRKETDRLTPDRRTGELSRLEFQTAALQERIRPKERLEREAEEAEREIERLLQEEQDAIRKERALQEKIRCAGAEKDLEADRAVYAAIRKRVRDASAKEAALRAAFPGSVPDRAELEHVLDAAESLEALSRSVIAARLSPEEEELLWMYRQKYGGTAGGPEPDAGPAGAASREDCGMPEDNGIPEDRGMSDDHGKSEERGKSEKRDRESEERTGSENRASSRHRPRLFLWLLTAVGVFLAGAGVFLMRTAPGSGGIWFVSAGIVLLVAAVLVLFSSGKGRAQEESGQNPETLSAEQIREVYEKKEYRRLAEKYAALKKAGNRLNEAAEQVSSYLASLRADSGGIRNAAAELLRIRDRLNELENAENRRKEAEEDQKAFERERGAERCQTLREAARGQNAEESLESLTKRAEQIREISDRAAEQIALWKRKQEKTEAELEEAAEAERELLLLTERQKELSRRYRILCRTREFLSRARISFSEKYMEPIQNAFDRYYGMAAGPDGKRYRLDASLNLVPIEQGASRDPRALSSGYQALVGLCRRMSLIEAMYQKEKPFLILDDPFALLDEEKLTGALKLLRRAEEEGYQILYFTCHESRAPRERSGRAERGKKNE